MEEILLKDICDLDNGYAFKSDDYIEESDTLNCRMSNIRPDGTFDILYSAKYLPDEFAEKYKDYLLNDGDLIIAMTDMAGDPKILGVPTVVDTKGYNLLLNQRVGRLRFIREGVNADYLKLALQCSRVRNYLKRFAGGGVQLNVGKKDILNAPVRMRSMEEQVYIAKLFKRVLEVKSQREKEIQLLDELIKARFVEMFGDPLAGSAKWSIHTVGDVAEAIDPQPSHRTPPIDESGIPYVSTKDCDYRTGIIDFEHARKVGRNVLEEHLQRYELHDGDFIIGKIGTIGNPIFVPARKDYTLSANIVLIQPNKKKVSPYFLKYSFMSAFMDKQFEEAKNSTSQAAFGIQKVRMIKVMNPSMEVQLQFDTFARQVDKSKAVVQKALHEAQLLFDSLMQLYFG